MLTEQEQKEFNNIVADPTGFLLGEFDHWGAFNTSIFDYRDIQDAQILMSLGQAGSLCAEVVVWAQYHGMISRVFYLAFWREQSGWELYMVNRGELSLSTTPPKLQADRAANDGKHEWDAVVRKLEKDSRPGAAWYFPRGTFGAETLPELTGFHANEKAQEEGAHGVS